MFDLKLLMHFLLLLTYSIISKYSKVIVTLINTITNELIAGAKVRANFPTAQSFFRSERLIGGRDGLQHLCLQAM